MQVLESLDPDLVMKALEKQLDAARVRRVAAGTESVRWKLRFIAASSVKTNCNLRETAFGRSLGMFAIFWNSRNQIGHTTMDILRDKKPIFENRSCCEAIGQLDFHLGICHPANHWSQIRACQGMVNR